MARIRHSLERQCFKLKIWGEIKTTDENNIELKKLTSSQEDIESAQQFRLS